MPDWKWFVLGLLVGWLIEWIIDWVWWRRRRDGGQASADRANAAAFAPAGSVREAWARAGVEDPAAVSAAQQAAVQAVAALTPHDHLELIEGIGPKIAAVLRAKDIVSFGQLAAMTPEQISALLQEAGPKFRLANPGSWPQQARLAAAGDWDALEKLQKELTAGVRTGAGSGSQTA